MIVDLRTYRVRPNKMPQELDLFRGARVCGNRSGALLRMAPITRQSRSGSTRLRSCRSKIFAVTPTCVQGPQAQASVSAARRRGFQTREAELTLPRMLGELDR